MVEVSWHESDVARFDAEPCEPLALVALRVGMIDLEPRDTGFRVAKGAPVIAGSRHDDLRQATVDGPHDDSVEERRARGQVTSHPSGSAVHGSGHVAGESFVRVGIAVVHGYPFEGQPLRRDPLRGDRCLTFFHVPQPAPPARRLRTRPAASGGVP